MARGVHPAIRDRFDLTLECIRRFYRGEDSPLGDVLTRCRDFFDLSADFNGYVEFFLLQDLTLDDGAAVRFHLPFVDFGDDPWPRTIEEYASYRVASMEFIRPRGERIATRRKR